VPDQFVDQAPGVAGTNEDAMHLDALVPGQSYFYNGTTPGASATLGQSVGGIEVVLSTGPTSALKVNVAATTATVPANSDTYLDVTTAGTYTQASVTAGAVPPPAAAGALRVWKITSGASAVVSVTLLAPTQPLNVAQVQNAATVAGTIPASSAGAPNGVATLNAATQVIQPGAVNPATAGQAGGVATLTGGGLVAQDPASKGQAGGVATLDAQGRGVQPAVPDTTEAATNDTLGATSTGTNNLNRMRYVLAQIQGAAWTAATAMIPLAQKGAGGGVASLNGSTLVVQDPASKGQANGVATLDASGRLAQIATSLAGLVLNGVTTVAGHMTNTGSTPTGAIATGASARVAGVSVAGTDRRCLVNITTTNTPGAGDQVTITFAVSYASAPLVQLSCQGGYNPVYISALSATGFTIAFQNTPGAGNAGVVCSIEQTG